ncbi:peptidyl-prolyl cis-trans isomerase [Brevibacillus formosus]|uniref:peptidyl-prolyl cis-trans isomerase n=1 Tax=Brevibacillus formosus TaxID=54913 RepID=UPI0018CDDC21|nr:peptidyl-prolyl cis-trans isomerase [Brevibacillus formosus]MBG9941729.1 peptidylprolyl isomerase [Brevibacillus formosus]
MTNVKGLWAFIGALVLLLLAVIWAWYQASGKLQPAAIVGDKTISNDEYVTALKQKFGKQVLNDMINREVVFQEAKRSGITVDPKQLEQELSQIRDSYGSRTDSEFEAALLKQAGTTVEALKQEISYQILLQTLATKDMTIKDEEILKVYNSRSDRYTRPMQMRLGQIVVASQKEAEQVLADLKNGADFQTIAKERSIDADTAVNGGDVGWVSIKDNRLPDEAKPIVEKLEKDKYSEAIKIEDQYVIYQLIERREASQRTFEEVKDELRREIAFAQVESLDVVLERLRKSVGVQISGQMPH